MESSETGESAEGAGEMPSECKSKRTMKISAAISQAPSPNVRCKSAAISQAAFLMLGVNGWVGKTL